MYDSGNPRPIQIMPGDEYYLVFPAKSQLANSEDSIFDRRMVWRVAAWALYNDGHVRALVAVNDGKLVRPPESYHYSVHRSELTEQDYKLATCFEVDER